MALDRLHDVLAPAKLNLFLHVTGRRDDGYHLLQSVFMLIDWCDTLHFDLRTDAQIRRHDLGPALPADDLIVRAALRLQQASGTKLGADIQVLKTIPAQAGMGGGSSDAASTLLALNRLWGLDWPLARLMPIGLLLGADVPFFLGGHNAWVEGIGEQLQPIELPAARFAVLKPAAGLETARIFRAPELERATEAATISDFAAAPLGFGRNDLQPVAAALCPEIGQALDWLRSFGLQPRMTGSGSAVFAHLARDVELGSPPPGWQLKVCSNMAVHPLAGWAGSDDSR
jgi:4-diphosphocytidyl-2-C-methyl-D-erythritol kinase